ncbi:MAG: VOC family protein [Spirosomataceae bacterium]
MAISPKTPGIHHLALRCTDMSRTKKFYQETLGFQVVADFPDLFIFVAGSTFIGVRQAAPPAGSDTFNPFNVGLDHLALGCEDEEELRRVADALAATGVENTGVKLDPTLGKNYVAFKDPDRISWEFYMV